MYIAWFRIMTNHDQSLVIRFTVQLLLLITTSMTRGCLVIRLSTKTQLALCLQRQCDHRPVYKTIRDRHKSSASASRHTRAMLALSTVLSLSFVHSLSLSPSPLDRIIAGRIIAGRIIAGRIILGC